MEKDSKDSVRTILSEIADLLQIGGERWAAVMVRDAPSSSEPALYHFLVSNELWGGAGSIADQCFASDRTRKKPLEERLIKLGRLQMEIGKVNVRTNSWAAAFEHWRQAGI